MRKTILTLAVAALLVGATGATAGSLADKEDTIQYKIDSALKRGEIDYDTALMYRFMALSPTGLEQVPARYRAEYYAEDPVSGTPVYLELMNRWPYMRAEIKNKITEVCGVLFEPGPSDGGTRYRNLPGFTVYANYGGFTVYHYDSRKKDGGENFRIHWVLEGSHRILDTNDLNQNGVPDIIENYARDAEYAWKVWWAHNWFEPPPGQKREEAYLPLKDYYPGLPYPPEEDWDYGGNDRWDIYLGQFTGGVIGMTTGDPFEFTETFRDDRTPYFLEQRTYDPVGEKVTVAHESNHGVQYMYDVVESSPTAVPRWYFEATATWGQEEAYPGDRGAIGRANGFLGNTLQPIDAPTTDNGYCSVIINYFLVDWAERYWKPPEWVPRKDRWFPRDVWRALAKGDEWYTDDPTVNRESKEAMGYLIQLHRPKYQYLDGRIFKDTFEYWTTWNWFTGERDDGKHYKYGKDFIAVNPQNTWSASELPLVKFRPTAPMNHLGHGFYRFDRPPAWPQALITFAGDESNDPPSKDWGGAIYVTKNGSTWTNLKGEQGQPTLMFTPEDKGIIQIRNPGQYEAIVAIFSNVSFDGDSLPFEYSYIQASDTRPPAVASGVGVTQTNPDYIELLVGADEKIFGKAEVEVYFTSASGKKRAEIVPVTAAKGNKNFKGKFVLDIGDKGSGRLEWRAADLSGNIVSGGKDFSAGFLASGGGTVGNESASLKLPAGAVRKPTLFLIAPSEEKDAGAAVAVAAVPVGGGAPTTETVGRAYEFSPNWARLAKPLEVTLSYEGLEVTREDYLSVYRWAGSSWEDLGGTVDKRNRRVVAVTDGLGKFILGYGEKKNTTPPSGKPMSFGLFQNYPNPARDDTVFKYTLPARAEVELVVYDLSGRRVATVAKDVREAGVYEERYGLMDDGGKPLPAGVYLYRLSAGADVATKKMVVVH